MNEAVGFHRGVCDSSLSYHTHRNCHQSIAGHTFKMSLVCAGPNAIPVAFGWWIPHRRTRRRTASAGREPTCATKIKHFRQRSNLLAAAAVPVEVSLWLWKIFRRVRRGRRDPQPDWRKNWMWDCRDAPVARLRWQCGSRAERNCADVQQVAAVATSCDAMRSRPWQPDLDAIAAE